MTDGAQRGPEHPDARRALPDAVDATRPPASLGPAGRRTLARSASRQPRDIGDVNAHFTHFGGISAAGYDQHRRATPGRPVGELLTGTRHRRALPASPASWSSPWAATPASTCPTTSRSPDDAGDGIDPSLDIAQAVARQGGVLVASTGYGFGDTVTVAGTEALIGLLRATRSRAGVRHRRRDGQRIGQALAAAKRQYLGSLSAVTPYDEKSSIEFTMYGMPQYRLAGPARGRRPGRAQAAADDGGRERGATARDRRKAAAPGGRPGAGQFRLTVVDGDADDRHRTTIRPVSAHAPDGQHIRRVLHGRRRLPGDGRPADPAAHRHRPAAAAGAGQGRRARGGSYVDLAVRPGHLDVDDRVARRPREYQAATSGWWPADPVTLTTIETTGGSEQRLVVLPGQFLATRRLVHGVRDAACLERDDRGDRRAPAGAPAGDVVGPTVRSARLTITPADGSVTAVVDAADLAGITRVDITQVGTVPAQHFPFAPVTPAATASTTSPSSSWASRPRMWPR